MTTEEILKKILQKAIQNGYYMKGASAQTQQYNVVTKTFEIVPTTLCINDIIFDHDFARAFWGEIEYTYAGNGEISGYKNYGWKRNIEKMALAKDRIKYLEKFL